MPQSACKTSCSVLPSLYSLFDIRYSQSSYYICKRILLRASAAVKGYIPVFGKLESDQSQTSGEVPCCHVRGKLLQDRQASNRDERNRLYGNELSPEETKRPTPGGRQSAARALDEITLDLDGDSSGMLLTELSPKRSPRLSSRGRRAARGCLGVTYATRRAGSDPAYR